MKLTDIFKYSNYKQTYSKWAIKLILLKKQSEHLLEVAKRVVEITIEVNDDVTMKYVNKNMKQL